MTNRRCRHTASLPTNLTPLSPTSSTKRFAKITQELVVKTKGLTLQTGRGAALLSGTRSRTCATVCLQTVLNREETWIPSIDGPKQMAAKGGALSRSARLASKPWHTMRRFLGVALLARKPCGSASNRGASREPWRSVIRGRSALNDRLSGGHGLRASRGTLHTYHPYEESWADRSLR